MSDKLDLTAELERLLSVLEGSTGKSETTAETGQTVKDEPKPVVSGDAIATTLAAAGRTTQVKSLREAPEIEAFRRELVDGLIRADTANQLLRLVNEVVTRVLR